MTSGTAGLTRAAPWQRMPTGDDAVAVAEREALGTSARVAVWPPENLGAECAATDDVLAALDRQASRFRADSELSWLNDAGGGLFMLGDGLAEAVGVALAAAQWTGGLTDPTVGAALVSLGYDRDFAAISQGGEPPGGQSGEPPGASASAPGWPLVRLDGPLLPLPPGIRLDLGATAKGVGSDRAVRAVMSTTGHQGGVLVSLGGDIAVAVAEEPDQARPVQLVRLAAGAVATSSVSCRRWRRGGVVLHHIVDPRTGRAVAHGDPGHSDLRRRQRGQHGGDRGGRPGAGLARRGGPAGPADRPRRPGPPPGWLAGRRRAAGAGPPGQPRVRRRAAMNAVLGGSQALWFVSRASGLALLAAFSAAVVLGVAARLGPRLATGELHRALALFSVAFLGLHVATAILDPYVTIGWAATLLPLASPYRTLAIGLGALAVDLGGAVLITSLARRRLGYRAWWAVHWLAYLTWPAAFAHAVTAGSDLRIW
jgi:thiamine biosynthesis lipoprotein ApbE